MEFTLLWAVLTAVALGWVGLRIWPERVPEHAFDRLLGTAVAGLAAGRLTAMITQGVNPLTDPAAIIVVRGGVHTGVASLVFMAVLVWTNRSSHHAVDAVAPSVLLALAGWHAGCMWRGTCLGAVSDLPWAWALPGSALTRHPVEIYAAAGLAIGAWLVSRLGWRIWLRSGVALVVVSLVRLVTEPVRPSITGGPVSWYVTGGIVGVLVALTGPRLGRSAARAPT